MEEHAKLILQKCGGLPLAISTIGGFLATKPKTVVEWRKMHGRISAELEINPELRTIKTVLMRSYDGLPYHLKLCFLYMSIFPEDYIIKRKRLVRRWIAEGYCKQMHGMTAEEVGDSYFDELLERSMILPGEGVNHHSGKIDSCQLHDIIREICILKAREENLVFTLEEGCCLSSTQGPIRHLAISSNWKRDKDVFDGMLDLSHVRSLTVYGEWRPYFISEKMRFLRVLDLEDTSRLINHHLDEIGQLHHLRYLSIRKCVHVWYLPNSIGNLSHLQTLDIKGTRILELPTTIAKLRKLQHLRTAVDLFGTELKQLSSDQGLYLSDQEVTSASGVAETGSDMAKVITTENNPEKSTSEIEEENLQPMSSGGDTVNNSTPLKKFDHSITKTQVQELFTGRETEQDHVINLVGKPENNQETKVISVWGMGGLGKTTLVRSAYRSEKLGGWKRAWVTALRPFDPEVLIRSLALQLMSDVREDPTGATAMGKENKDMTSMGLQDLIQELNHLLNKKCLIVLDDISTTAEWDLVRSCLKNAGTVIVTTREKNVAKHCSREETNIYRLEGLKDAAALDLFKRKVFKDKTGKVDLDNYMEEQARLILKKCDGLPLAISTIGGFLATQPKTANEWRKLQDHISAELEINPELKTIKTVVMRSYDGLPYHLKSCFLYMSIFPKDCIIERKRLVRRWIAEGYCMRMHGMTAEEVGDNYFDELLDRRLILPGDVNYHSGKIDSCQLHDVIREICISKAKEENLVFTLEEGCCSGSTQGRVRHLVISSNWKRDKDVFDSMLGLSCVRSLTVYGEWRPYFISKKMRLLRVLDLDDTSQLRNHHLDEIGQLHQLRYLSIRKCIYIWRLPNSIGNLRNLETLDIKDTRISELPTTITNLRRLSTAVDLFGTGKENDMFFNSYNLMHDIHFLSMRRLRRNGGRTCSYRYLQFQGRMCLGRAALLRSLVKLLWSAQRSELGLNMHDLFNLHRSLWACLHGKHVAGVKAPRGMGKLTSLQTLGVVSVTRGQEKILKELSALTQLRKLGVTGINQGNGRKFWSAIAAHNQLRSLTVYGDDIDGCLGGDLLPPKHLESLKLDGPLYRVTHWMHHLQSLSKLDLEGSRLDEAAGIQTLGGLPNLKVLRLRDGAINMDRPLFLGSALPSLVVLQVNGCLIKSLRFEKDAMPKFELLQTDKYLEMEGLQFLTNLKEIRMNGEGVGISKMKLQLENQYVENPDLKNVSLKLM